MPKRIVPLSDLQVNKAKAAEKDYKIFDGGGLYLLVTPSGGKLWHFKYRFADKEKKLTFGNYPEISLSDARQRRDNARKLVANGVDPGEVKKAQKATQTETIENSFEVIAREWHAKFAHTWVASHAKHKLERMEKNVFPWIGAKPISEITAPDALKVLRLLESRNLLDTAHRVRFDCGQVFRYAIATGRADRDPTADLRGALPPVKGGHHAAPTDPREVAPLLRAIDGFTGSFVVKCAMQLAPLLFVRPGELRAAEWSEIDLENAEWNIPPARMKMKISHLVPLSRQAVEILKELQPLTGHSRYVFPCHRSPLRCMSDNAVNAGLRRMGFEKSEITGHGFRAMARTILDEVLEVRTDFIEHQLAHVVKDPNGTAYNRTKYLPQRRQMMQQWADYLDTLKSGEEKIR
ncbi:MAG: integrase arm-type DNA-binding domain-containing protein [Oryzomonas sp.]|uniref:tyrosine-type recombinase/integrase n=1 Tax=Oryzomonas sp. TaxID=2855186 RepID=UPI00284EF2C2|nr:integrase arm-type DNA-binding domain-containing protein [Oryzomonas sp.]MDR3581306.1 integrase arm-type DNA-binding domain-containing protein [Oryzomonas sp.]